jgi:hypothetical protein
LANALAWYWLLRGRLGEARRWFDAALALGGSARWRAPVLAWSVFAFQQGEFADGAARRTRAELFLAFSALESGELPDLEAPLRRALPVCEQLGRRTRRTGAAHRDLDEARVLAESAGALALKSHH